MGLNGEIETSDCFVLCTVSDIVPVCNEVKVFTTSLGGAGLIGT